MTRTTLIKIEVKAKRYVTSF